MNDDDEPPLGVVLVVISAAGIAIWIIWNLVL